MFLDIAWSTYYYITMFKFLKFQGIGTLIKWY